MQKSVEQIMEEAEEAVRFLETLLQKELPDSLDAAIKQDWMLAGVKGGEEYLSLVPGDVVGEFRKRVISIERANEILLSMESRMIERFVQDKTSVAVKSYLNMYFGVQFWLSNVGAFTVILGETIYVFRDQIIDAYISAETVFFEAIFGSWLDAWRHAKEAAEKWTLVVIGVVAVAFGAIAAITIQPIIAAFGAGGFALAIKPVRAIWDDSLKESRKKAFPQGTGRWRRRNPSRRN